MKGGAITANFRLPKLSYRVWKVWMRDRDVFMKTFKVNFVPPMLEPVLYLLGMGFGLGLFVHDIEPGVSYVQFIAPSLVAIGMMFGSFFECTYASFVRMYYQKTFDAIIATPVNLEEVIAGELLWGATKSLVNSSIVLVIIALFGLVLSPLALLIPPLSFLAGLLFASVAMCFTAVVPNIDAFNYPQFLLITPMFLFSGTFFPITVLPPLTQTIAQLFFPLTHTVALTRNLILGRFELSLLLSLAWLMVATIIFFILSINLMKRRLIK